MNQMWSVVSWGMDMPYWEYTVLPLDRDQTGYGIGTGTVMEMRPVQMIAEATVLIISTAHTCKMRL